MTTFGQTAAVFLDNSTYFSFKRLIEADRVDADSLYNAATFLECLVAADDLIFAPTTAWQPGASDPLFAPAGPCRHLDANTIGERSLSDLFEAAVASSQRDVREQRVRKLLSLDKHEAARVDRILEELNETIKREPQQLLAIYSGAVFTTDAATREVLNTIPTLIGGAEERPRHIAQYLLRTNAAVRFSENFQGVPIPYHPHSHRTGYVLSTLSPGCGSSAMITSALLRDAEAQEEAIRDNLRTRSMLSRWGGFGTLGPAAPIALGVALAGARDPEDIVARVLELRSSRQAIRYRAWAGRLVETVRSGSLDDQLRTEQELEWAREELTKELNNLYGRKPSRLLSATAQVASRVELPDLPGMTPTQIGLAGLRELLSGGPRVREFAGRIKVRHSILYLVKLIRAKRGDQELNDLLGRVFRRTLDQEQMQRFAALRRGQARAISAIQQRATPGEPPNA